VDESDTIAEEAGFGLTTEACCAMANDAVFGLAKEAWFRIAKEAWFRMGTAPWSIAKEAWFAITEEVGFGLATEACYAIMQRYPWINCRDTQEGLAAAEAACCTISKEACCPLLAAYAAMLEQDAIDLQEMADWRENEERRRAAQRGVL
jgi:hypothetical protein